MSLKSVYRATAAAAALTLLTSLGTASAATIVVNTTADATSTRRYYFTPTHTPKSSRNGWDMRQWRSQWTRTATRYHRCKCRQLRTLLASCAHLLAQNRTHRQWVWTHDGSLPAIS